MFQVHNATKPVSITFQTGHEAYAFKWLLVKRRRLDPDTLRVVEVCPRCNRALGECICGR